MPQHKQPEFDEYAAEYDRLTRNPIRDRFTENKVFFHTRKWSLIERFFAQRGIQSSRLDWLDMGCGKGELLSIGKPQVASVAGCDVSPGMLSGCQEGIDARLQTSPTELPFGSRSFDFVTAVCIYHHVAIADRAALTKEVVRVLRPGGRFCIIEHNPLNPVTRWIVSQLPIDRDAILLSSWNTGSLQRSAGLRIEQTVNFLYFPETVYKKIGTFENWLTAIPLGGQYAVFGVKP